MINTAIAILKAIFYTKLFHTPASVNVMDINQYFPILSHFPRLSSLCAYFTTLAIGFTAIAAIFAAHIDTR